MEGHFYTFLLGQHSFGMTWQHLKRRSMKVKWEKEAWQTQSYPGLQQLIQLYCYLYITDTLYSGEITGRIIHVFFVMLHKDTNTGVEDQKGGEGLRTVHTSLHPLSPACQRSVCLHTYLDLLGLTWQPHEERNWALLLSLTPVNPPFHPGIILLFPHTQSVRAYPYWYW